MMVLTHTFLCLERRVSISAEENREKEKDCKANVEREE